ncbi:alpha/beta hydrolase [Tumidithrix elongata RA019]|uniref:Alpha/beta hydrolase n=1 Tax=Tumidithrix elongata BACA0141 TaxID=2716417 RepID=A0AAW9PQ75_9CYAN|nr:alpha/beta hydrolase [Tumidithrix elongata RA019]
MPNYFLPKGIEQLTEATSIALANSLQFQKIATPLSQAEITTAFVHQGSIEQGGNLSPIVFLHGFDSSVLEWRRLLPLLSSDRELWAIDLLGFGFTERPLGLSFNSEAIKAHLYSTWKALIARPVTLVGASMGGAAAIDFTLTYPEIVEKLILIDSVGFTGGATAGKFLFPPLDYIATQFLRNPKVRQKISEKAYYNPSFASPDALCCAALHLDCPNWQQALISFTKSGGYGSFKDRLAQVQPPSLILWGDRDRILGTKDAENLRRVIPHSQLIWIEASGHVPHLEQPQSTAKHIREFSG